MNFFVYYHIDDDTSNHNLCLANYGELDVKEDGQWVLLEKSVC